MKKDLPAKANILGDLRAEYDHKMLEKAFYESPDYRSLIEAGDRAVIVGRRGAGKSALFYKLRKRWQTALNTKVITIAPEDFETIGLHGTLAPFKHKLNLVRAAAKLGWRYAMIMEIGNEMRQHFKFCQISGIATLINNVKEWANATGTPSIKIQKKLELFLTQEKNPEALVGELANKLQINILAMELGECLNALNQSIYVLIDRLDEGYEADELGIGLIDGFLHASIEVNRTLPNTKAFIFLRDNIFRTIAKYDADYSRQIEGQVIRLHWDEYHLLNLVANRFRAAFSISIESSINVWNEKTCRLLLGREGFQRCLRLTLYRPRDLLVLLNNAFYNAFQHGRDKIFEDDIDHSATEISESRYSDLIKEYQAIFPGIERMTRAFSNQLGQWTGQLAADLLNEVFGAADLKADEAQQFKILGDGDGGIQALYSIGFLGLKDTTSTRFKFCHDGNQTKLEVNTKVDCLIHPCYWRALNIRGAEMNQETLEEVPPAITEIRDEYDIEISSNTPEIRKHRLGQIISAFHNIPEGEAGSAQFEDWCHQAISILFAGGLSNVELKPNGDAIQRRDIVARNQCKTDAWRRIMEDFGSRQVVFEVKNYRDLGPNEYRQMNSYLVKDYGHLGFIISREEDESLRKDKDLGWVKEMYYTNDRVVVKLTGTWLVKYLSKARSPQKHDAADIALNGLVDRYIRNYFSIRHGKGLG